MNRLIGCPSEKSLQETHDKNVTTRMWIRFFLLSFLSSRKRRRKKRIDFQISKMELGLRGRNQGENEIKKKKKRYKKKRE